LKTLRNLVCNWAPTLQLHEMAEAKEGFLHIKSNHLWNGNTAWQRLWVCCPQHSSTVLFYLDKNKVQAHLIHRHVAQVYSSFLIVTHNRESFSER
jgi:hypothetical protein